MIVVAWLPDAVRMYLGGAQDALNAYHTLVYLIASPKIRKATARVRVELYADAGCSVVLLGSRLAHLCSAF